MLIDRKLLEILVCPISKQSLSVLSASKLDKLNKNLIQGDVKNHGGNVLIEPIASALITENGKTIYPIMDNIPVMLEDESIDIEQLSDWF